MYKTYNVENKKNRRIDLADLFKSIFLLIKKYYYLFIIGVVLSLLIAFLYVEKKGQVYNVYTSMIIEEDGGERYSNNNANLDIMYSDMARLLPGNNNVDNQIYIMKSYDNVFKTVKRLNFDVSYYKNEKIFDKQIFRNHPFVVVINKKKLQLVETEFEVEILKDNSFRLEVDCSDGDLFDFTSDRVRNKISDFQYQGVHKYGELIENEHFSFSIKNISSASPGQYFSFYLNDPHVITASLRDNLSVDRVNENAGIVEISLKTTSPDQGINILNTFTEVYMEYNLNKKNAAVDKMIDFIESQFDNISSSLKASDDKLQVYQSDKSVVDIAAQSQIIIEQVNNLENERSLTNSKQVYLEDLKKNINKGEGDAGFVVPSVMGIQDAVLNNLVNKINEISIERSALCASLNNPEANPQVIEIDAKLNELKKSLLDNVNNIISQLKITSKDINRRIAKNRRLLKEMPSKQRGLVNIQRNNEINSELYSKLLEKKLNYYIMKASNIHNKDIVEKARLAKDIPLVYKKEFIFIFALFWGIMIPVCIVILIMIFDNKIKSRYDIEEITNYPFIGAIPKTRNNIDNNIMNNPLSILSNSYRLLRYKLDDMCNMGNCTKMLVTSALPKEGKTTVSINIASTFAMAKKKTIVIGYDLRNPNLGSQFSIKEKRGMSSYLNGTSSINDIINKTDNHYLDVIVGEGGYQNISELIESDKLAKLIYELEKRYHYIIFDTPPVGLVSDALALSKFVDLKLLIVRRGKTHKKALEDIINKLGDGSRGSIGIVFNEDESVNRKYFGYKQFKYNN